jgi:hypothetical protein
MKRGGLMAVRGAVLVIGALVVWVLYTANRDHGAEFEERRGRIIGVDQTSGGVDSLGERTWLTVRSSSRLEVACGVLTPVPRQEGKRYPAVVLLGGKATGKHAVDYALGVHNVIVVALEYPYEARTSYTVWTFLQDVPALRNAIFEMFPSVKLVMDYLRTRADVDTTRIVMLGYSFGAPFVPCAVAYERRFAAAAMVYGGGNLRHLVAHNVGRYRGAFVSEAAGMLAGWLLGPLEPMRYTGRISPVPLIMINGTHDEQIPREDVEQFYQAAAEPKTIRWIESGHVHPRDPALTRTIVATLESELQRLQIVAPPPMEPRRHRIAPR